MRSIVDLRDNAVGKSTCMRASFGPRRSAFILVFVAFVFGPNGAFLNLGLHLDLQLRDVILAGSELVRQSLALNLVLDCHLQETHSREQRHS